ncbi:MAG: hypothetical protein O3A10_06870 [Chloroflexi bacterium]|nr:hypothetical protein [Chloroflexota bacterium]MDA1147023.1 hypothetical protein [Chloroflexota bacterium]
MIRRLSLVVVSAIAVVMLLGACGSDDDGTATAEATSEATSEATAEGTAEATAEMMEHTVDLATTGLGDVLVGHGGLTLYLFTNDEAGVSNCVDGCAAAWPPLTVEAGAELVAGDGVTGTLGVIERADGTMQVTINDVPLYHFASDAAPGDTGGQGVNDVWFAVAGDGTAVPVS